MSDRLRQLLRACWSSPIFGDAYASPLAFDLLEQRMATLAQAFAATFAPIVRRGLPDLAPESQQAFVREATLRVAGLCAVIGCDLADPQPLGQAALCFGLLSLGDSFIDRDDSAMERATTLLLRAHADTAAASPEPEADPLTLARLAALEQLPAQIQRMSHPDDAAVLLQTPGISFLQHSLALQQLNRQSAGADARFWLRHGPAYISHSIMNIETFGNAGLIYALYRQQQPSLPSLAQIAAEPQLTQLLDRCANAALRIFDDVGDQEIDSGATAWGPANFNIFNRRDPQLLQLVLEHAGIRAPAQVAQATRLFLERSRAADSALVQIFAQQLRDQVAQLPPDLAHRYATFLMLAKRLIESGYVNALGDQLIAAEPEQYQGTNAQEEQFV